MYNAIHTEPITPGRDVSVTSPMYTQFKKLSKIYSVLQNINNFVKIVIIIKPSWLCEYINDYVNLLTAR